MVGDDPLGVGEKVSRTVTAILVLAIVMPSFARASGINLSWSDCGEAGSYKVFFGCETNEGQPYDLVGSFYPPPEVVEFVGLDATISVFASSDELPDWWHVGAGQCRATGLSVGFDFLEGPFTCADPFGGLATGSMAVAPSSSPSHLVLRLAGSLIGATVPLSESVEY